MGKKMRFQTRKMNCVNGKVWQWVNSEQPVKNNKHKWYKLLKIMREFVLIPCGLFEIYSHTPSYRVHFGYLVWFAFLLHLVVGKCLWRCNKCNILYLLPHFISLNLFWVCGECINPSIFKIIMCYHHHKHTINANIWKQFTILMFLFTIFDII